MAAHSSILAWRIPWTEKPGRVAESDMTERLSTLSFFCMIFDSLYKVIVHICVVYSVLFCVAFFRFKYENCLTL